MIVSGTFLVKKRLFKQYLGTVVKVQQSKSHKQAQMWISCSKELTSCLKSQLFETDHDPN